LGSSENKWLQVLVLYFRGLLAYYEGGIEEAGILLEETIALAREGQFKPDLARSLVSLGRVKLKLGEESPADEMLGEALSIFQETGNKLGMAISLEALGFARMSQNRYADAVRLFATAHTLRQVLGAPLPPIDRAAYDLAIKDCETQLGEPFFTNTWEAVGTRSFEEVTEEMLKADRLL
jgi:tetratricopeptide (TPR) repeat protein